MIPGFLKNFVLYYKATKTLIVNEDDNTYKYDNYVPSGFDNNTNNNDKIDNNNNNNSNNNDKTPFYYQQTLTQMTQFPVQNVPPKTFKSPVKYVYIYLP